MKLHGQPRAVAQIAAFLKSPQSRAFLFHGPTGTGKTTSAYHIADSLGCDRRSPISGFSEIASGEQNADAIREIARSMAFRPMSGLWRVVVVNEADKMTKAGEVIWLDLLEKLPPNVVVIFTTNNPQSLSQRFRDRCRSIEYLADARSVREFARQQWRERMPGIPMPESLAGAGCLGESPSYRAALQDIEIEIECAQLVIEQPARIIVYNSSRVWGIFAPDEVGDAERMQSALAREMPGDAFFVGETRSDVSAGGPIPDDAKALTPA